jgi:ABC-2 type transport system permease protein/oleandomycin transport system permease protein
VEVIIGGTGPLLRRRCQRPVTRLAYAVRGLMAGGPVATPALWSLLWAAGIAVVFFPLAMRTYRARI